MSRGVGAKSAAIGSFGRTGSTCRTLAGCARMRSACAGCARGAGDGTGTAVCTGAFGAAKIGAGCGPVCRNSALVKIHPQATVAISPHTNSRGRRAIMPPTSATRLGSGCGALRTFLDLDIGGGTEFLDAVGDELYRIGAALGRAERQFDGDARSVAEPACNVNLSVVQPHESFHN